MNSDVLDTIETTLTDALKRCQQFAETYSMVKRLSIGEQAIADKMKARAIAIDAALAECKRLREAGPQWEPLIDGVNDDICRSLSPEVGVWVYGDGEHISLSTSQYEIFADLPDDIRLCRRTQAGRQDGE